MSSGADRCASCGFDSADWNPTDAERTLHHGDELLAEWTAGVASTVEVPVPDPAIDDPVHRLWHRLVAIAAARRDAGDRVPSGTGVVAQVNVSGGGAPKRAVDSAEVGWRGLVGDRQRIRRHHGRPWQALSLWSAQLIDRLAADGHPVTPGATGENLTLDGIDWSTLRAGALVEIGEVRCQLSAAATPCANIGHAFADRDFRRIDHQTHPGWSRWYASVRQPGIVRVGDAVAVVG